MHGKLTSFKDSGKKQVTTSWPWMLCIQHSSTSTVADHCCYEVRKEKSSSTLVKWHENWCLIVILPLVLNLLAQMQSSRWNTASYSRTNFLNSETTAYYNLSQIFV